MSKRSSPARTESLRLRVSAMLRTLGRNGPNRSRRRPDDGAAPMPATPAPSPLPMQGGAEATLD